MGGDRFRTSNQMYASSATQTNSKPTYDGATSEIALRHFSSLHPSSSNETIPACPGLSNRKTVVREKNWLNYGPDALPKHATKKKLPPISFGRTMNGNKKSRFNRFKWTSDQDEKLIAAIGNKRTLPWRKIAEKIPGMTDLQCIHRWKILRPKKIIIKGNWKTEEDKILIQNVNKFGLIWHKNTESLSRTSKQCRDRWVDHLDPNITKKPFTPEELEKLEELIKEVEVKKNGNIAWACITHNFNVGRPFGTHHTQNQIKNICRPRFSDLIKSCSSISKKKRKKAATRLTQRKRSKTPKISSFSSGLSHSSPATFPSIQPIPSPLLNPAKKVVAGVWTPDEDEKLTEYVKKHGVGDWNTIAKSLQRKGKSCSDRWCNHLDPDITKKPLSKEECQKLVKLVKNEKRNKKGNIPWISIQIKFNSDQPIGTHRSKLFLKRNYYFAIETLIKDICSNSLGRTSNESNRPGITSIPSSEVRVDPQKTVPAQTSDLPELPELPPPPMAIQAPNYTPRSFADHFAVSTIPEAEQSDIQMPTLSHTTLEELDQLFADYEDQNTMSEKF